VLEEEVHLPLPSPEASCISVECVRYWPLLLQLNYEQALSVFEERRMRGNEGRL